MSRNYITFDNTDLKTYGLYISGTNTMNAPVRAYDSITIPGRNGALIRMVCINQFFVSDL